VLIGVVSDIHCNSPALDTALEQMAATVDQVFVAGDVVYEYRYSSEVVTRLRSGGFPCVLGNHEMVLLGPGGERARAGAGVDPQGLAWMGGWPTRIDVQMGGRRITMVHGSPWEPFNQYLTEGSQAWNRCPELDTDIVLTGHTHMPMVKRVGSTLIVNPGSLGESREVGQRDLVSYAVIDLASDEVEIVRFPNPRLAAASNE
jgi:putative phosphoesterase